MTSPRLDYKCFLCDFKNTKNDVSKHIFAEHKTDPKVVKVNEKESATGIVKRILPEVKCPNCNIDFKGNKSNLNRHLRLNICEKVNTPKPTVFNCEHCKYTSTRKDNYERHLKTCKKRPQTTVSPDTISHVSNCCTEVPQDFKELHTKLQKLQETNDELEDDYETLTKEYEKLDKMYEECVDENINEKEIHKCMIDFLTINNLIERFNTFAKSQGCEKSL